MVRFLEKSEFGRTVPLFEQCFGKDPEFEAEYYGDDVHAGEVRKGRIAVLEEDGRILSMVHLKPVLAEYGPEESVPEDRTVKRPGGTTAGEETELPVREEILEKAAYVTTAHTRENP